MKVYVAYGSNLDTEQMAWRCPKAKIISSGMLEGWELIYRRSYSGAYATIRKAPGKYVPVGLWKISAADERALDRYEGFPTFYQKHTVEVLVDGGKKVTGMVYIMRPDAVPGYPTERYIDTIYRGYQDFGLDGRFLMDSLRLNQYEMGQRQTKKRR
jgi:gamma-glutamylcyclotransferase (GGCT)/AIG2-like uncharacterized protein YtfP